ncbi:RNA-binding S4 domain-containing protein [Marinicella sediminis]|nr:RNA-binding S4 domain-containing protein [Marinicella sediminis]
MLRYTVLNPKRYIPMTVIIINREPVELYKILKFEGLVGTGGEAKMVIDEGLVTVNGMTELRKRKKINSGDVIEFNGESYTIEFNPKS